MVKSISCEDAGKECKWSATAHTEEDLMEKVKKHVQMEHKEISLTPDTISSIKSLIKEI